MVHRAIRTVVAVGCGIIALSTMRSLVAGEVQSAERAANGGSLTEAQKLAEADPEIEFRAAKKKGQIYFRGVMGAVVDVPGVKGAAKRYLKCVPVRIIEGTSDVLGPGQDRQVRQKVRAYAERYNALVVAFLNKQSKRC